MFVVFLTKKVQKKEKKKTRQKKSVCVCVCVCDTREQRRFVCSIESIERYVCVTATRAQCVPVCVQQQQRPRFLTSRASVSFSSSSSSVPSFQKLVVERGWTSTTKKSHRRRSLPSEDAKTGRGVVVAGRFPDERTYIMIKCVVVYVVVVVFRLSS